VPESRAGLKGAPAQTADAIDGFVQSVGTSASLRGTSEALRKHNANIRVVAVEPAESLVLSRGKPGAHKIDGIAWVSFRSGAATS
jgi:cysteine synthase